MQSIEVVCKNDVTIELTLRNKRGKLMDLTGGTVFLTVKSDDTVADNDATLAKTITSHITPLKGRTNVALSATDTDKTPGEYIYDCKLITSTGAKHNTPRGVFTFTKEVTTRTA